MPIVLGYDVETTGLDTKNDRIIEVGAVVWDTEENLPIQIYSSFVSDVEILPEHQAALDINGIKPEWLCYGKNFAQVFLDIQELITKYGVSYIMAHNGEGYDKPITFAEYARSFGAGVENECVVHRVPWLDTRHDLPFKREPKSMGLNHLAMDQGFINPFQHRAVFDVLTMLKVASAYDINEIIALSKIPFITVRALVDYADRQKAKDFRFSWENLGGKTYPKFWVKKLRENQLEKEQKLAEEKNFKIVKIE